MPDVRDFCNNVTTETKPVTRRGWISVGICLVLCLLFISPTIGQVNTGSITCNVPVGLQATWSGTIPSWWGSGGSSSGGSSSSGYRIISVYMLDYNYQSPEEHYVQGPNSTPLSTNGIDTVPDVPPEEASYDLQGIYVWYEYGIWVGDYWYCDHYTDWYYIPRLCPTCFVAGTPIRTPNGSKLIEHLQAGDLVLSSRPTDSDGDVVSRRITEVKKNRGQLLDITVNGRVIRATKTHPFYVKNQGWTAAAMLSSGDLVRSHDRQWCMVQTVVEGTTSPVYNLSVEKDATYFVGGSDWDFSVWVSAACDTTSSPRNFVAQTKPNPSVTKLRRAFQGKIPQSIQTAMATNLSARQKFDVFTVAQFPRERTLSFGTWPSEHPIKLSPRVSVSDGE